mmetsp:Transcript_17314/g.35898  ORF Transcript_17314/g.35898 Transcript_17314/m.35898 type:complete len:91 (+) Transcript_17314:365-637(+)
MRCALGTTHSHSHSNSKQCMHAGMRLHTQEHWEHKEPAAVDGPLRSMSRASTSTNRIESNRMESMITVRARTRAYRTSIPTIPSDDNYQR